MEGGVFLAVEKKGGGGGGAAGITHLLINPIFHRISNLNKKSETLRSWDSPILNWRIPQFKCTDRGQLKGILMEF